MLARIVGAAGVALSLACNAAMAEEGDAGAGLKIARERCARCHNVEKGGAFKLHPPSFQAIAIYRDRPDIWGRIVAPSPHISMPDMQWVLSPGQVQDLLAYITSLDTAGGAPAQ